MLIAKHDIESIIDASLGATPAPTIGQVEDFARKTLNYDFAATLAEPFFVRYAAPIMHEAGKKVCSVISYPLGSMNSKSKLLQAKTALADGADELDVALNVTAFKSGHIDQCKDDLRPIIELAEGRIFKLLYFASILDENEQLKATEMALELGFPFLKTNPGFGYSTTVEQCKHIKEHFGDDIKVMVSGGVRTKDDAIKFVEAGVSRIATSAPFRIVDAF